MKTQESLNRTSGSERSLEIFIWIAAILVFIIFLIGSSASASNGQFHAKTNKTLDPPSPTHLLSNERNQIEIQELFILRKQL